MLTNTSQTDKKPWKRLVWGKKNEEMFNVIVRTTYTGEPHDYIEGSFLTKGEAREFLEKDCMETHCRKYRIEKAVPNRIRRF